MYRVQCTLPFESGLPEDVITNTYHFETDVAWGTTQDTAIDSRMQDYYELLYAVDDTFRLLASYVQDLLVIRVFEANPAVSPNPPVHVSEQALTIGGTSVNSWPSEVAVVTSQFSALTPGARLGRYFNRQYLGGFTGRIGDATTNPAAPVVVREEMRDRFASAADFLNSFNNTDLRWVIGRRAGGVWVSEEMTGGFVGNEFDTQRRRGTRQSVRSNWNNV